ncbi:MerR family transcriptional regulator [Kribbella sp. DT2]|uniref:MerR family transcriptional regulator n=1 Tax=Kribbella sp. DT2 TaxID=3393427 RepID=UPI003CE83177
MNDNLLTIGELAQRTGLAVRTIRFYADQGVVPPTRRTPAGHRLYDVHALMRLDLVRTLRELGVDLPTIRQLLDREVAVAEVAAAHADALETQIRALRVRQAVVRVVARRGSRAEELHRMHQLAELSDQERRRLIGTFIDDAFGDLDANPELVELLRSAMPELPDDPTPEQLEAWIELADLVRDPAFKTAVRRAAEHQAAERAAGDTTGLHHDLTVFVRDRVTAAIQAGVDPAGLDAVAVVTALVAQYCETFDETDTPSYRRRLVTRLEVAADPLMERYWQLLAVTNCSTPSPSLAPVFRWFLAALRAHTSR